VTPETDDLARRVAGVRAVLFDLDGTLVDSLELILASARHATRVVLGEPLPDDVLRREIGIPLREQMELYAPGHSEELLAAYRAHNAAVHDDIIAEYPGVEGALSTLKDAGFTLGVVTSKAREWAQRGIDLFGLGCYLDTLVALEDTATHKPRPEPVIEGARRLGFEASSCAYVGDSPHDMNAAIAAGMVSVAALWGPFPERVLEPGPDFAVNAPEGLSALFTGDERRFRTGRQK